MHSFPFTDWNTSLCFPGQYHFVANSTTWDEARRHCRETFKDLATIQSAEDVNQLVNTASSFGYNNEVWIGLFSVIDWRWSDGSNGSGWEYRNWENLLDNEPDFYSFRQFCVNVGDKGRWWDDVCSIRYPFICYRGKDIARNITLQRDSASKRNDFFPNHRGPAGSRVCPCEPSNELVRCSDVLQREVHRPGHREERDREQQNPALGARGKLGMDRFVQRS